MISPSSRRGTEAALLSISARATAELRRRSLRDHLSHHLRLRLLPHLLTPKAAAPTRDGGRPSHLSSRPASNRRGLFASRPPTLPCGLLHCGRKRSRRYFATRGARRRRASERMTAMSAQSRTSKTSESGGLQVLRAWQRPPLCRSAHSSIGKSGPNWILTVGDSAMFAVYVLGDTWRLHATFSTRDAAEIIVARLVSRGVRAKLFRTAETQRRAA